ncbi:hypothetical protein FEK33_29410 [Nocardia asteroides NBRC 15531]|uniref:Uncharacterized protein n=1 Tax=Nocardia asteroides NBRC 15531 TaxID=1110697 RepID=U5E8G4_NOCAS|nr:hypothetical protein [Nocardia asteroides]TLF62564.1 hypothetical protein FEK33_29410 [Nocardia asteroides NBRC 15531]UGT46784.1 hypothetical protein LT345_19825 [Nocardia asteroides]GAD81464.1 hypothetical protein NCAST_01_00320 [Nocardia asteroides NBRC 15531]
MEHLVDVADRFAVGELGSEELTMVAADALARGLDCAALVELACLHRADSGGAPDLFRIALAQLGLDDRADVSWEQRRVEVIVRRTEASARRVLVGDGDPYEHCAVIGEYLHQLAHIADAPMPELSALATDFEVLRVDWEDGYGDPAEHGLALKQSCERLLGRRA